MAKAKSDEKAAPKGGTSTKDAVLATEPPRQTGVP